MSRAVLAPFEAYQNARVTFVQTVAELAQRPQNIEALQSAGKYNIQKTDFKHTIITFKILIWNFIIDSIILKLIYNFHFLGVMALLRPLLLDNVPSIQQSAALALGRLANYSDELAEAVVSNEILPQLVYSLSEQNVSYSFKF